MFIDEITLNIMSGKGGDGIVSWMHEKGRDHAGPGGGDGGRGGDVYLRGVRDISLFSKYKFVKAFKAPDGNNGGKNRMDGKAGDDIVVDLPLGSVVKDISTGKEVEVLNEEQFLFLKGGRGGYGNNHFKGSKNVNPMESTLGKPGEGGDYYIELKLVVDLGLIGLPNAGKSSLLNALTNAKAKVGNYKFTTLNPNLGDFYGYVLADIPGLIEGAGEGKGLGHNFLRHISRTKALLHCISCENPDPLKEYNLIRNELNIYDESLLHKPEIILITKTDLVSSEELSNITESLKTDGKTILSVSTIDDESVKNLSKELVKILKTL